MVGFREVIRGRVVVSGSNFRKVDHVAAPAPTDVEVSTAWKGGYDGRLVRMNASVVESEKNGAEFRVVLRSGRQVFAADLLNDGQNRQPKLDPGSKVEVTGVWLRQTDVSDSSLQYRMLLRANSDLLTLSSPPGFRS